MPHTSKKQQLDDDHQGAVADGNDYAVTFDDLGVDLLANIFGFLSLSEIMRRRRINDIMSKRRVCRKWREAVRRTIVPPTDFCVYSMNNYNAMRVMTRVMPNLQQIDIGSLDGGQKYNDGEDPDEEEATTRHTHDIGIISNFTKLRILEIYNAGLNGRYPFLFNSFPLLQKLRIRKCYYLKFDLEMLATFPLLKEFHSDSNYCLTGNINSLRALKDTLQKVHIGGSLNVEGNFMDLADFPHLKELNLGGTAVTGDIRDIGSDDFSSLECLVLPKGVYGGNSYEMQRISDGPDLIRAVYRLKKQRPMLKMNDSRRWYGVLSEGSPDWYESVDDDDTPPFDVTLIEAGSRIGYRWETGNVKPCEVNWLDPEPEIGSRGYDDYLADYQRIQGEIGLYRGYYEPPTEEEYTLLYEEHVRIQRDDEDY